MPKFMCYHSFPAGRFSRAELEAVMRAAQNDPVVRGHQSFANLTEGQLMWIVDAPDEETLARWFKTVALPFDSIIRMEVQGDGDDIRAA